MVGERLAAYMTAIPSTFLLPPDSLSLTCCSLNKGLVKVALQRDSAGPRWLSSLATWSTKSTACMEERRDVSNLSLYYQIFLFSLFIGFVLTLSLPPLPSFFPFFCHLTLATISSSSSSTTRYRTSCVIFPTFLLRCGWLWRWRWSNTARLRSTSPAWHSALGERWREWISCNVE